MFNGLYLPDSDVSFNLKWNNWPAWLCSKAFNISPTVDNVDYHRLNVLFAFLNPFWRTWRSDRTPYTWQVNNVSLRSDMMDTLIVNHWIYFFVSNDSNAFLNFHTRLFLQLTFLPWKDLPPPGIHFHLLSINREFRTHFFGHFLPPRGAETDLKVAVTVTGHRARLTRCRGGHARAGHVSTGMGG